MGNDATCQQGWNSLICSNISVQASRNDSWTYSNEFGLMFFCRNSGISDTPTYYNGWIIATSSFGASNLKLLHSLRWHSLPTWSKSSQILQVFPHISTYFPYLPSIVPPLERATGCNFFWTSKNAGPEAPRERPPDPSARHSRHACWSLPLNPFWNFLCQGFYVICWIYPPPSNSHHQEYYIFSRESL